jgi:signal transduction histidine kinase
LVSAYPDLDWIAAADSSGRVVASVGAAAAGSVLERSDWFAQALQGPWIGPMAGASTANEPAFGVLAAPLRDAKGDVFGVVAARQGWSWPTGHLPRLTESPDPRTAAQAVVLDRGGIVRLGPHEWRGKPWPGVAIDTDSPIEPASATGWPASAPDAPHFERLPGGARVLVARSPVIAGNSVSLLGWQVLLSEPIERAYQRADALGVRILWVSLCLGALTAMAGAFGARHLTERLKRLTRSAIVAGHDEAAQIEVPAGRDEVAQLASAFAKTLADLRRERSDLRSLGQELERRVAVRTREVERLAEESRYAAVMRERLQIARDLHDTLAHSMMTVLSEIRLLRRLQAHDPAAVPDELARAEVVAQDGLNEARTAIAQMRVNAVRDTGLGAALSAAFERFIDHTGLAGSFTAEPEAARFGDERAETIFRIAEEALRNVERHALATRIEVNLRMVLGTHAELKIADNGVGFDPVAQHPGHFGLIGLREQALMIGAELRIDSRPGTGTTLWLAWRVTPEIL